MKALHLTLKKKYFDMIASGEKKEEYRELKLYWVNRFIKRRYTVSYEDYYPEELMHELKKGREDYRGVIRLFDGQITTKYNSVKFRLGYAKGAPMIHIRLVGIGVGYGKPEWGATDRCFILKLGEIYQIDNYSILEK
jgi:hypothetical protein